MHIVCLAIKSSMIGLPKRGWSDLTYKCQQASLCYWYTMLFEQGQTVEIGKHTMKESH